MTVAAKVDQSADEGPTDVDGAGANAPPAKVPGNLGAWESSGIVDASEVFGPGAFFVDDPGEHAVGREGDRRPRGRPGDAQAELHEQALGRAARAAPHPGRVAARTKAGQASGPDPLSSSTTKPGPPANRQWSMFVTRPSRVHGAAPSRRSALRGARTRSACGRARCASRRTRRAARRPPPGSPSRIRSETMPSRSSTEAASPYERASWHVAARPRRSSAPSSRYAVVSAWTTSQSPSSAIGGSAVIQRDVLRRQRGEVRVDAAVQLPDVVERLRRGRSSRPCRTAGRRGCIVSWFPSRQRTAPALSRSRRRTRSIAPMPSGPRSTRSPRSQRRASPPVHDSPASSEPGVAQEVDEHVAVAVDVAHGEDGPGHRLREGVGFDRDRRAARLGRRASAKLADELERLAVLDELLEPRELGLEPVGVDRGPRDQVDLRMLAAATLSRRRRRAPRGASRPAPAR